MGRKFLDEEDNTEYEKLLQPPPRPVTDQEQAPQPAALAQPEYVPTREMAPIAGSKLPQPELEQPPEDAMAAYQRLSKQAEEATPSEEDVLAANMRRTGAQLRAEAPAYLEKAAETLFYKPDYSQITRVAEGEAKQPDMILSAKEQAQKRLEALAEGARKRALLPAQQAEMQARTAKTKIESEEARLKMDALKETARLNADKNAPASPEDIQKFRDKFGKLGADVPDSIKKGDLSKAWSDVTEQAVKGGFTVQAAKVGAESREKVAEIGAEGRKEGRDIKSKEELVKLTVPGIGVARTKEDAETLKKMASAKTKIELGLSNIQKGYKDLIDKDITNAPSLIKDIGDQGKSLIMEYKEYFRLGAPQAAELKFLYGLIESEPANIGKAILSEKVLGINVQARLNKLKDILKNAMATETALRTRTKDELPPALQSQFYPEQQTPAAAPTPTPTAPTKKQLPDTIKVKGKDLKRPQGMTDQEWIDYAKHAGVTL